MVEGTPRIDVSVNEGSHGDLATAAILVNAISSLLRAERAAEDVASPSLTIDPLDVPLA